MRVPVYLVTPPVAAAMALITAGAPVDAAAPAPTIGHVWVVVLENQNYASTFQNNPNPYLPHRLPALGALLTQYYGTGHASLDNYIAMVSGQGPAVATQSDCQVYGDVVPGIASPTGYGQVLDDSPTGCVYPSAVPTVGDQLDQAGLTWKGYMEDLGADPARDAPTTCHSPATPPQRDSTQIAEAQDQYATRHDPFMYFRSVIDRPGCAAHVVNLASSASGLVHDLASEATTPNLSLITPNLCDDGHDSPCAGSDVDGSNAGGLTSADHWLAHYVPLIASSPAFRHNGMLAVIFDESGSDGSACCGEQPGPNTLAPGATDGGAGGGRVGAVVLSPFVHPGTVSNVPYNHYSLLRTIEDQLGMTTGGSDGRGHLGFAGQAGLQSFGNDVFTGWPQTAAVTTTTRAATPVSTDTRTRGVGLANTAADAQGTGVATATGGCAVGAAWLRRRRRRLG